MSLGIETPNGKFFKVIEKNTLIPTKRTHVFTSSVDFQTTFKILILQGEHQITTDNISIGLTNIENLTTTKRVTLRVEVTFDIDSNGILNVTTKDLTTGKKSRIKITASKKITKEDKDRTLRETNNS